MKRKVIWALLTLGVLVGASLKYTPSAASSLSNRHTAFSRAVPIASNLNLAFATTLDVDRADDTAAATACTAAPNDCSLRGAIIAANNDATASPVTINLQPATTYNLTLTNAAQENAAATGDLDITTSLHTVTIEGGGSSGPNATFINAAGLNTGSLRDRAFQITGPGVTVIFQDLVIQNGKAADDGTSGMSTNPTSQNANRFGGGILNNGGSVTLDNVVVQSCQALGKGDSVINDHTTLDARGGGLASLTATGNVVITGSTLTGNTALGGDGGNFNNGAGSNAQGGSIYLEGGTLNIEGSRIENSAADGGHGGNVSQNGQTNGGFGGIAQGGGAWVGGGTVSIDNTTFESTVANGGDSGTGGNGAEPAGPADGGGLYSLGNVTVTNSTFHLAGANGGDGGNAFGTTCLGGHMGGDGGGARGGAIFADGGSLIVNTATFADNSAIGGQGGDGGQTDGGLNCGNHGAGGLAYGGAITNNNAATINIKHGTLSLNNAQAGNTGVNQGGANKPPRPTAEGAGGGIRVGPAGVTLENTIIAGNSAANGAGDNSSAPTPGPNVDGTVTSNGHNLLGVATEAGGFVGTGDQTGVDPILAALADNGGPTRTMALSPGSPAIDAGVAAGSSFDQRGKARTYDDPGVANAATGDGTDIGAFELQPICSLSCPTDVSVSNDTDACGAVVTYTVASGAACGTVTCDHPSGSLFAVGDTTVTCTSSVGPTCSFNVTVKDTQAPAISAPADAVYQCASEVPAASPSQANASDNCGAPTVGVSESSNGGAGSPASPLIITRTYTATDSAGLSASATQTITVIDNTPPAITCPPDISLNAPAGTCSASVNFTVLASDNCSVPSVVTSNASGSVFPLGTTTVVATATDAAGNSRSCSFKVTVKDVGAPVITTNGQTITLWPPDHKYATVKVTDLIASASDTCDPSVGIGSVRIAAVTSDEPDNSGGDGNTTHDISIAADCKSVQLRSERMGKGNGRVYTITFKVTDASGNVSTATAKVTVPHSQNGSTAVDDGPHYTVSGGCP
ncbi:MAG: choice-of-anchor Q domain-containing protein [Pyrinomonadaceae bacterium]